MKRIYPCIPNTKKEIINEERKIERIFAFECFNFSFNFFDGWAYQLYQIKSHYDLYCFNVYNTPINKKKNSFFKTHPSLNYGIYTMYKKRFFPNQKMTFTIRST